MGKAKATVDGAKRTYEVITDKGSFEIEVPENYRVTFAPVYMGDKSYGSGSKEMALRFYENENKQRAIFVGVKSFRDLSLPMKKIADPTAPAVGAKPVDRANPYGKWEAAGR